jgi:hypothetical protein
MTKKTAGPKKIKKQTNAARPGMMGDGTEKKEVEAVFGKQRPKK